MTLKKQKAKQKLPWSPTFIEFSSWDLSHVPAEMLKNLLNSQLFYFFSTTSVSQVQRKVLAKTK